MPCALAGGCSAWLLGYIAWAVGSFLTERRDAASIGASDDPFLVLDRLSPVGRAMERHLFEPWRLYPGESGVFDRSTRHQFYYHSHGAAHEAGHFHTVRLFADHTAHLVAISMRADGRPQALFTLNLWAIGNTYESAGNLRRYVRRFRTRC